MMAFKFSHGHNKFLGIAAYLFLIRLCSDKEPRACLGISRRREKERGADKRGT